MAVPTTYVYNGAKGSLGVGEFAFGTGTLKLMLVTPTYTFSAAHRHKSDVTGEVVGTGYTAGGNAIGSPVWTYDSGTGQWVLTGSNVTFTSALTAWGARGHIVYRSDPSTDATRPLLGFCDYGTNRPVANGDFPIIWDALGILRF
jgi:hypothetical protein